MAPLRVSVPIALLLAFVLGGCGDDKTAPSSVNNTTDPTWVVPNTGGRVAIVYVHGLFGDTVGTWVHPGGARFFDLVNSVPDVAGRTAMFAYGFPSNMIRPGSFGIREAANRLHLHLEAAGILKYPDVVFVAHSMGGLVVLHELLTHPDVRERVPLVVLFGTPQEGAQITRIAQHVANNPALAEMLPADGNDSLQDMNDKWRAIPAMSRPHVACAYENRATAGITIVPWSSATRFCDDATPAIDANHLDIVKPDRASHDSVLVVTTALTNFVFDRKLETPDFRRSGDGLVLELASAVGRQSAALVNAGRARLHFSVAEPSDPLLYLWPENAVKELPSKTTDHVYLALGMGARATEYQFVLRSDALPDMRVTVRVPTLAQVQAQQAQLVQDVAAAIERLLADPATAQRLRAAAAGAPEAPAAMVAAARDSVARMNPDLPESAQWMLAAEALHATNWPGLASAALREAERADPASAQTPAAQRLAATAAALSGETRVFSNAPTPALSPAQVAQLGERNLLVSGNAGQAVRLAGQLRDVPALKVFGLSLDADAQKAAGNTDAARRTLQEAAAIRSTPSVRRRLESVGAAATPANRPTGAGAAAVAQPRRGGQ